MLSPASVRLCCLAVMAPALTKADRRADCLPVVLSDPFCVTKTASYNRKDKIGDIAIAKHHSKLDPLIARKRSLMQKTCFRTCIRSSPESAYKTRVSVFDLRKSLVNVKVNAETKSRPWHSANARFAAADKVRLKYTMNKNNTLARNMGLARANASIGLHDMKKLNRITQFTPRDKGNASSHELGERSPNSEFNTKLPSMSSVTELSYEQVASTDNTIVSCYTPPQDCPSDTENVIHLDSDIVASSGNVSALQESDLPISPPVTLSDHDQDCSSITEKLVNEVEAAENDNHLFNSYSLHSSSKDYVHESRGTSKHALSLQMINCEGTHADTPLYDISSMPSAFDETSSASSITFPDCFLESHIQEQSSETGDNRSSWTKKEASNWMNGGPCCTISSEDIKTFQDMLLKAEEQWLSTTNPNTFQQKLTSYHVKKQLGSILSYYQKRLSIPCQRQSRSSHLKPSKELVDLKAELLQNEDAKNLSTAELVSLVRKLESTGSPSNLNTAVNAQQQEIDAGVDEAQAEKEECAEVMHISNMLEDGLKNILWKVDPELTDSSEDEDLSGEVQYSSEDNLAKKILEKYLVERAILSKKHDWLIGRMHELENQQRSVLEILEKVSSTFGDLAFEESSFSTSSALSTAGSEEFLQTSIKQAKKLPLMPLNGFLDHSSLNNTHLLSTANAPKFTLKDSDHINEETCSRTKALKITNFKKRNLLITTGLHATHNKLAKLSTVDCDCNCSEETMPCVLCMGRYSCIQSIDPDAMSLSDKVALLDKSFHPVLSLQRDIPLSVYFENILKKNEAKYQIVCPVSPLPNNKLPHFEARPKSFSDERSRSRKLNRYTRSLLSAKYHNKKHLQKHKLVFGKWRKFQNKSFHARERNRLRRISLVSSNSSHDSPIPSPLSLYDDGSGFDRKRPDDNQFDIDDVIIPYSNKRGRLVKFEFKDIVIPNWRVQFLSSLEPDEDDVREEDISEEGCIRRHERCEIEERKILRKGITGGLGGISSLHKRSRRQHRSDSRADSSGANTPDPVIFYDQDIFQGRQDPTVINSPLSPAMSPPTTPSSANLVSDDSQPAFGSRAASLERRKLVAKRLVDDNRSFSTETCDEVPPYDQFTYPLSDAIYDNLLAMSDHNQCDDTDVTMSGPSCPASPVSTTSSTSTIEDDDDPEWTVVQRETEQCSLVMKFAKR